MRKFIFIIFFILLFPVEVVFAQQDIKVMVLPFEINSKESLDYLEKSIPDILASRLGETEGIAVIERHAIEKEAPDLLKGMEVDTGKLRSTGQTLQADYIVTGSLNKIAETISLDTRIIPVDASLPSETAYVQGKGIDSLVPKIGELALLIQGKIHIHQLTPSPERVDEKEVEAGGMFIREWESASLPFEINSIAVGDLRGNGNPDIVVAGKKNVQIYAFKNNTLELLATIEGKRISDLLAVDLMDLNGNGRPELFISNVYGSSIRSNIHEWSDKGEITELASGLPWLFRAVIHGDGTSELLCQKPGSRRPFYSPLYRFQWQEGQYQQGESLQVPKGISLFGLNFWDADGDGNNEILFYTRSNYLRLEKADGSTIWESPTYLDGSSVFFERMFRSSSPGESGKQRVYVQGRMLIKDYDRDGKMEIVVRRNVPLMGQIFEKARYYTRGEIKNFEWNGFTLEEKWHTPELTRYIADFFLEDLNGDGKEELMVGIVTDAKGMFRKPNSKLMLFSLPSL